MCVVDGLEVHNSRRGDRRRYLKVCKRLHSLSFFFMFLSFSRCNTSGMCKACCSPRSLYEIAHILPNLAPSKELWCLLLSFVFVSGWILVLTNPLALQVTRVSGTVREAVVAFVSECCRGPKVNVHNQCKMTTPGIAKQKERLFSFF